MYFKYFFISNHYDMMTTTKLFLSLTTACVGAIAEVEYLMVLCLVCSLHVYFVEELIHPSWGILNTQHSHTD